MYDSDILKELNQSNLWQVITETKDLKKIL